MVAIQRGTERPNDVVIIQGHIDSRVTDVMNFTSDAPGANDDGSGTAAVIEAARMLSKHKFPGTIVYAALSGEEQGLLGGKMLANYAKAQGWNVVTVLNNDIIGGTCGSDGVCDSTHARVLSEGPRSQDQVELMAATHSLGGENDAPSRNISRFLDSLADRLKIGLDVRQIWRTDRFSRGGDHIPFLELGYPAARISVAVENYDWQHQDLRTENGITYGDTIDHVDFPYLAKMTKLNVAALAAIASAPPPPEPKVEGAVSTDTTLTWAPVPGAVATRSGGGARTRINGKSRSAADECGASHPNDTDHGRLNASVQGCSAAYPRRRLGVRRLLGEQGRLREPGRVGGARRRVQTVYGAGEEALTVTLQGPFGAWPASGDGC